MSNRRAAAANRIRGPQSALTDFLASHNISAQQISSDYQRRQREAQEAQEQAVQQAEEDKENVSDPGDEAPEERKKRKRKEEKAILKIKQSKEFKRRKSQKGRHSDEEHQDDDSIARSMLSKAQPLPGQLENCEVCEKRFTVTPYSKSGPDGGLLCSKCSKELADEEKKSQPKKKRGPKKGMSRQTESDRMMGIVKPGSKSLLESCVTRVADVIHDIEEFGDLPQALLDRLSQILSRRRVITSHTLDLFLRSDVDKIDVYDCGKLEQDDFKKIFAFMPDLVDVNLRFAGQFKDDALMYMIEKTSNIKNLQLGAANLISDKAWRELFQRKGPCLESLKLSELNDALNDESIEVMASNCYNLRRIKLRKCVHMTESSLISISKLKRLEHLSLAVAADASSESLSALIKSVGPTLRTLSLENYDEAGDCLINAIQSNCKQLSKLRLTGNSVISNLSFANLFSEWSNPPIPFIDLSSNRSLDHDEDSVETGIRSEAFKALMRHSGSRLERLNLASCRHISHDALSEVFDGLRQYPYLHDVDLSFISVLDDSIMDGIFKSCPRLAKLAVFACFNGKGVQIPTGIAVIGLPNALESVVIEG